MPEMVEDSNVPAVKSVATPAIDAGGDVKVAEVTVESKAGTTSSGKKKKKGKK